ncbi:MAG: choice-of-anchor D domain-containing protein [Myxococcota bacterium]|nr:choice-of-anchor D domain-containing protein [Myxococcota bacterium]
MSVLIPLLLACNGPETTVSAGKPDIALSAPSLDFGEVVLGRQSTITVYVENSGIGDLTVELIELDGTTSADFTLMTESTLIVGPSDIGEISVRYVPDVEGQDYGRLRILSDDADDPEVELDLSAFGVEPLLDVDPSTLWFGHVGIGDTREMMVELSARGSGALKLKAFSFLNGEDAVYSVEVPDWMELPYAMESGQSVELPVRYTPIDEAAWEGELIIETNDPTTPEFTVTLLGNTKDDPTKNSEPVVQITDPDWGDYYLEGDSITVTASVYDQEDTPELLFCMLRADLIPVGSGSPNSDGMISILAEEIGAGDISMTMTCFDTENGEGSDSVEVSIFDPIEPLKYTITGGSTLFDYWSVDDDVTIYVNGSAVFSDSNHQQDNHPPTEFDATIGDTIRIVAEDYNYCMRSLDPLFLHFGAGYSQDLNAAYCQSACVDDECYDGSFEWASGAYYDEEFTIVIP